MSFSGRMKLGYLLWRRWSWSVCCDKEEAGVSAATRWELGCLLRQGESWGVYCGEEGWGVCCGKKGAGVSTEASGG